MKIVADDKIPFLKGVFEPYGEIKYLPGNAITNADLIDSNVLLTRSITACNASLLKKTGIKLIATATIGADHIDTVFCSENNIQWETAKGCNADAVVQYVIAAILEIGAKSGMDLTQKTLGIIGLGEIGSAVAEIAQKMGMKVLLNDPPRHRIEGRSEFVPLERLQEEADIVSIHVPLTFGGEDKTFHLLGDAFFEGLQKPITLINTSRGAVLESEVLKSAVRNKHISHLVLDVWENEPNIDMELLELTEIATPHVAGYSMEGKANATAMVVHAVSEYFGLGIDDWYPQLPGHTKLLKFDCQALSPQEIFRMAFNAVYPIHQDVLKLKTSPELFEDIRGDYVFRHENGAYSIVLSNASQEIADTLKKIGFKLTL